MGTPSSREPLVVFDRVRKVYPTGAVGLDDVSVAIYPGEFVAIVGLSGAGKTTFLRAVNRLIEISSGEIFFAGRSVTRATPAELRRMRRDIGMVFQNFNLVKRLTVLQNVLAGRVGYHPTWRVLLGLFPKEDVAIAMKALERVQLADKAYVRADQLSGGQQQRIAVARALAQEPRLILADEPVASLDPVTAEVIMDDLRRINRELGITVLVNLHFVDLARRYADRILGLRAGKVVFDGPVSQATDEVFEFIYGRPLTREDMRTGEVAARG